jgi:hypothetical protein
MFYFVTSGAIDLLSRESCVVESAAHLNPSKQIFVLFLHENITDVLESATLLPLLSYENVLLRHIKPSK